MSNKPYAILASFRWMILGGGAVALAGFSTQIWLLEKMSAMFKALRFKLPQNGGIPDYTTIIWIIIGVVILGILAVLAGFFLGMARARRCCQEIGLTRYKFDPVWVFLSFFIPLVNLYLPWAGIGETRRSIFVTLETQQTGKRWNKFGDRSAATVALAFVILGCLAGEIAYNLMSRMPTPTGLAQAYASLQQACNQIYVTMALLTVQVAAFYTYLATLERPLQRLCDLSITGALSPEI